MGQAVHVRRDYYHEIPTATLSRKRVIFPRNFFIFYNVFALFVHFFNGLRYSSLDKHRINRSSLLLMGYGLHILIIVLLIYFYFGQAMEMKITAI